MQPIPHWYLHHFLISLCNYQIPQFPYLHLKPLCLTPSNLILLSLVLQYSCVYQNFQALTILNSIFTLWIFRLIPQNLQKLLIFSMSLPSIMNLLMFSTKLKPKSILFIVLMTLKSIWKKILNLQLAPYTLFWHLNKKLSRNSLRKTSIWVSSYQHHLCIVYWSYSLRRKIVHYTFVLTSAVLTAFPKRIVIYSHSSLIYWSHQCSCGFLAIYKWYFLWSLGCLCCDLSR